MHLQARSGWISVSLFESLRYAVLSLGISIKKRCTSAIALSTLSSTNLKGIE